MHVLFMNSMKPRIWRGGEKWMVETASGLASRGHSVYMGVRPKSAIANRAAERGLEVFPIRFGPDIDPLIALRIRKFIQSRTIDLVCTNFDKELRLAGQATLFMTRPAIVARKGLPYIFDKWYYRLTYRRWVDHIVCPSKSIASKLRELPWLDEIAISVIPNGVRAGGESQARHSLSLRRQYGLPDRVALLGFVGDLGRQKGVDTLLRALTSVGEECHLLVIGDGGERSALESLAAGLNLKGRVTFAGHRRDAASLYDQFDIVLCPSLLEGMPNVVLEAMAAGRPVIASAVDGILEIMGDTECGLLVPPGDELALSSAIMDLLRDAGRRKTMGAAAAQRVAESFSMEKTVDSVENLFDRLARDKRRIRRDETAAVG